MFSFNACIVFQRAVSPIKPCSSVRGVNLTGSAGWQQSVRLAWPNLSLKHLEEMFNFLCFFLECSRGFLFLIYSVASSIL